MNVERASITYSSHLTFNKILFLLVKFDIYLIGHFNL